MILPNILSANFTENLWVYYDFEQAEAQDLGDVHTGLLNISNVAVPLDQTGINGISKGNYTATDYYTHTFSPLMNASQNVSISVWVKSWNSTFLNGEGIFHLGTTDSPYGLNIVFYSAGVNCELRSGGNSNAFYDPSPIDDEWHHIICLYDAEADEHRLYWDGVSRANTSKVPVASMDNRITVGGYYSTIGFGYPALNFHIDEIAVWTNRTLNQEEITELYNDGNGLFFPFSESNESNETILTEGLNILADFSEYALIELITEETTTTTTNVTTCNVNCSNCSHNNLTSLQGGFTDEYYHLNLSVYNYYLNNFNLFALLTDIIEYTHLSNFTDDLGHIEDNTTWNEAYANSRYLTSVNDDWVNETGDTMTGNLTMNNARICLINNCSKWILGNDTGVFIKG